MVVWGAGVCDVRFPAFGLFLSSIAAPVFATSLLSLFGLYAVLLFDVASFLASFAVLLFFVELPERVGAQGNGFRFLGEGLRFFRGEKGFVILFAAFAGMNFFSSVTYENILPAMLLSRTGGSEQTVGAVSAAVGLGGFAGSLFILFFRMPVDRPKTIFFSAAFSFLFGDLLMGFGRNEAVWIAAALAASVPVSLINGAETALIYEKVSAARRESVFALKNVLQYSVKPAGFLLVGFLADSVFGPFLKTRGLLRLSGAERSAAWRRSSSARAFWAVFCLRCSIRRSGRRSERKKKLPFPLWMLWIKI